MAKQKDKETKPEPKIYAGQDIEVKDIKEFPLVVQRVAPGRLPRIGVIKSALTSWRQGEKQLQVWDEDKQSNLTVEVQDTDTIHVLTGRRGRAALETFRSANRLDARALPYVSFTNGTDPEIFVVDKDNKVVPAWKYLPEKKLGVSDGLGGTAYWDGFQAEFTPTANRCLAYMLDATQAGLKTVLREARKVDPSYKLSIQSVLPVDPETLATAEDRYVEFGCMPSKNAYGLEGNNLPGRAVPMRFAGGHIHLGLHPSQRSVGGVKGMDAIVGVACVSLFEGFDNPVRREFYGLPGEYRTPKHGIEYRALSNAWLMHPLVANMVFDLARLGYRYGLSGINCLPEEEIIHIMTANDVTAARDYMKRNEDIFMMLLKSVQPFMQAPDLVFKLFASGAHTFIKDPSDIEGNWLLNDHWLNHCEAPHRNFINARALLQFGSKV